MQGLAGQQFIAVRRVIDKRGDDDRIPHHIERLNPFVYIHVGMMGPGAVFERVLDEAESGESDRLERRVVGAADARGRLAGTAYGNGRHAQVSERFHPGAEYGCDPFVPVQADAADRSGPGIDVEIGGESGVIRLQLHRGSVAKVFFDISVGAEQTLFLACP